MKDFTYRIMRLCVFSLIITSCVHQQKKETAAIMVYAGASLTDVISELRDSFEVEFEQEINLNMASSGTLARQIELGGNPDIYISASLRWAEYIDSLGYLISGYKMDIAFNDLVLIAPVSSTLDTFNIDSTLDIKALLGEDYLSIGNPAHVPAGKYARQSLAFYKQFESLEKNLLLAKDVRSALMLVEMEEAKLGLIYRTDALKSNKVKVLTQLSDESHKPIRYVAGLCKDNVGAKAFFSYINSEKSKAIWEKHGFRK